MPCLKHSPSLFPGINHYQAVQSFLLEDPTEGSYWLKITVADVLMDRILKLKFPKA